MFTQQKRQPAYTDLDSMPFGKHVGKPLQDVPAKYLAWLRDEMRGEGYDKDDPTDTSNKRKLYNYIHNSWDAIKQELGN